MSHFLSLFFSMRSMAFGMIFLAFVLSIGTYIEYQYGLQTAQAEVYQSFWFEGMIVYLCINIVINVFTYKIYRLNNVFVICLITSFIFIILGGGISRYGGVRGYMYIDKHEKKDQVVSREQFLTVKDANKNLLFERKLLLSKISSNSFNTYITSNNKSFRISLKEYIPNSKYVAKESSYGKPVIAINIYKKTDFQNVVLKEGDLYESEFIKLGFGKERSENFFFVEKGELYFSHNANIGTLKYGNEDFSFIERGITKIEPEHLYSVDGVIISLEAFLQKGVKELERNQSNGRDAVRLLIEGVSERKEVVVFGQEARVLDDSLIKIEGETLFFNYGSKYIKLPFEIELSDFDIQRYPGSQSISSYLSKVVLVDKRNDYEDYFDIGRDVTLEYNGYRLLHHSFNEEQTGVILHAIYDPGKSITFLGYTLITIAIIMSFLFPKGHFQVLLKRTRRLQAKNALMSLLLLGFVTPAISEEIGLVHIDHAKKFGKMLAQDQNGRVKTVDTLSHEILNKVYRNPSYENLHANQVLLGMTIFPKKWQDEKIIYLSSNKIAALLGLERNAKYASYKDFFNNKEELKGYKLAFLVEAANKKPLSKLSVFEKKLLKVDERVNISYLIYSEKILKILPRKYDKNQKWYTPNGAKEAFSQKEVRISKELISTYLEDIKGAIKDGRWAKADRALAKLISYQKFYGVGVYLSNTKIRAELFYNELNIFESLMPFYFVMGVIILILEFIIFVRPQYKFAVPLKISLYILTFFFVLHSLGLFLRWYISGYVPWTNAYGSMLLISWATIFAGIIFSKNSPLTLATTGILSGIELYVAHLNWIEPQITNIAPVLKSNWLSIHMLLITASYGFLALGALLSFMTLVIFAFKKKVDEKKAALYIRELNYINEMNLMIGLALFAIGNILGAVWASSVWGRYWAWAPKESWALITILSYAIVIHLRFISKLYTQYNFSLFSLLAFSSVLMTYFGVNHYFDGLHSFAKSDFSTIPTFVYYIVFVTLIVVAFSFKNRDLKHRSDENINQRIYK